MKVSGSPKHCTYIYIRKRGTSLDKSFPLSVKAVLKGPLRGSEREMKQHIKSPAQDTQRAGNAPSSWNCEAFGPPSNRLQGGKWCNEPKHQTQSTKPWQGRAGGTSNAWHTLCAPHHLLCLPHHHALPVLNPPPFSLPSPALQIFQSAVNGRPQHGFGLPLSNRLRMDQSQRLPITIAWLPTWPT